MKKVLLLIDLQSDFCKGGELAVPKGEEIIPLANRLIISDKFHCIATQDNHPADHKSFASNHKDKKPNDIIDLNGVKQTLWVDHCISGTKGADFHKNLLVGKLKAIFRKGQDKEVDSYSGFLENDHKTTTGLAGYIKELKATELYILGLALDYCVKHSVLDAVKLGFATHLILDGCKAINIKKGDDKKAVDEMVKAGAVIVENGDTLIK